MDKNTSLFFTAIIFLAIDYLWLNYDLKAFNINTIEYISYFGIALRIIALYGIFFTIYSTLRLKLNKIKIIRKPFIKSSILFAITINAAFFILFTKFNIPESKSKYIYVGLIILFLLLTPFFVKSISKVQVKLKADEIKTEDKFDLTPDKNVMPETNISLHLKTVNPPGYFNIPEPNMGVMTIAGTGSGKTASVVEPFIEQIILKELPLICYDFKFPSISNTILTYLIKNKDKLKKKIPYFVINFSDMYKTHRTNVLHPKYLESIAFVTEFATTFINNLDERLLKSSGDPFFINSAISTFKATIWFQKNNYPEYCTLPHIVSMILYGNTNKLIDILMNDIHSRPLVSSLDDAREGDAKSQLAGVLSSLKDPLSKCVDPKYFWVLSGDDFNLDINDPKEPKILLLGNDSRISDALAPFLSLFLSVAFKRMNVPNRLPSFTLLDEFARLYIPNFNETIETARENKICTCIFMQTRAQLNIKYKKDLAESIMGNMAYHLIGKTGNLETAKYYSDILGTIESTVENVSSSNSLSKSSASKSSTVSYNIQEKTIMKSRDIVSFKKGEFFMMSAETDKTFYKGKLTWDPEAKKHELPNFHDKNKFKIKVREKELDRIQLNHNMIISQACDIINNHDINKKNKENIDIQKY